MNELILTVGLPRSGKTTWAMSRMWPVVSPDAIRLALHGHRFWPPGEKAVHAFAWQMVGTLFLTGHRTVIVDATHITRKRRDAWLSPGMGDDPAWPTWTIRLEIFKEGSSCLEACLRRADPVLIPVIERMNAEAEWPTEEEL